MKKKYFILFLLIAIASALMFTGNAQASFCTDSDGGINEWTRGKTAYESGVHYDSCEGTDADYQKWTTLQEWYCVSGGDIGYKFIECNNGCIDGVCKKSTGNDSSTGVVCIDSDNGQDYYVYGTVKSSDGGTTHADWCQSNVLLKENYCDNGYYAYESYTCPHGCSAGACIEEETQPESTCTDSDGGVDYYTYGTASMGDYLTFLDACGTLNGNSFLSEVYCENNEVMADNYTCPYGCNDGACVAGIIVISPNGGEDLQVGAIKTIEWDVENIETVDIYLRQYGTNNYTYSAIPIVIGADAIIGSYAWSIEEVSSGERYKIEIIDGDYSKPLPNKIDLSDDYFSISLPAEEQLDIDFEIVSVDRYQEVPDRLPYNSLFEVSWNAPEALSCDAWNLSVPIVGGGYWSDLTNLEKSGTKELYARHPQEGYLEELALGIQCWNQNWLSTVKTLSVKVSSPQESLSLINPNGGELINPKETLRIHWQADAYVDRINIELQKGSQAWHLAYDVDASLGTYFWKVDENLVNADDYKIVIWDNNNTEMEDTSDNYFSIGIDDGKAKSLNLLSPNGGEMIEKDIINFITWDSENVDKINIELQKGSESWHLAYGVPAIPGRYFWTASEGLAPSGDYKVVIWDAERASLEDSSDGYISIARKDIGEDESASTSSCLPDGTLIKIPSNSKIYVIQNCQKKWIRTQEEFQQQGYKWEDVQETATETVNNYSEYLETQARLLRKIGDSMVYRIIENKRVIIPTQEAFATQKLRWSDIEDKSEAEINQYERAKLLRAKNGLMVYYITESGMRRHVPSAEVFNSYGNKWEDIVEVDEDIIDSYEDSILIKAEGDKKVYELKSGIKKWIKTAEAFNKLGYDWNKIAPVNRTEMNTYQEGSSIQ